MKTFYAAVTSRSLVSSMNVMKMLASHEVKSAYTLRGAQEKVLRLFPTPDDAVKAALFDDPNAASQGVQLIHLQVLDDDIRAIQHKKLTLSVTSTKKQQLGFLSHEIQKHDVKGLGDIFKGKLTLECLEVPKNQAHYLGVSVWKPDTGMSNFIAFEKPEPGAKVSRLKIT